MSLSHRLVLTCVTLVAVAGLCVATAATLLMRSYLTDRLDDELRRSVERAVTTIDATPFGARPAFGSRDSGGPLCGELPPISRGQAAQSITAVLTDDCSSGVQITDAAGLRSLSSAALAELATLEPGREPRTIALPASGDVRAVARETATDGTIVVQALPTSDVSAAIERLLWWEVVLTVGAAALAALGGRWLVRRQLQPLREVASTALEVSAMPLDRGAVGHTARVPARLTDPENEVGQVGGALNRLLGHVEGALEARHASEQRVRQFLADASHELRTPLSTIRGYAELGRRTGTDQLAKVESEAARMTALVEDMLLLAHLDSGRPVEHGPVDLSRLVAESVGDASVVDTDRTWRLELPEEPVEIDGDAARLHQGVTNLLRNASRHTPAGTVVTTRVLVDEDAVWVEVHDDGPGLPPDLVPVVFERFTRGDTARSRAQGGAGLGTSLVRAIAEAHGGTAGVRSVPGDTTFTIRLPRSERP